MIQNIKPILYQQPGIYGGFFYCLANLLNNPSPIAEKSQFVNKPLTNFYRNKYYHKYTNQLSFPKIFLERNVSIPIFSIAYSNPKYQKLFKFDSFDMAYENQYNIYFTEIYLTPKRRHFILLLKDMATTNEIYVIDPMDDYIVTMNAEDFFTNYYVIGYDELISKYTGKIYIDEKSISHLIDIVY